MIDLNTWNSLEPQWQNAFNAVLGNEQDSTPTAQQLIDLSASKVLRIAGPNAPHPTISFELTNLNGVEYLTELEIVVLTHHRITSLKPLTSLTQLNSIFVNNNEIESLEGLEHLTKLTHLYVQCNRVSSLLPLEKLTQLKEIAASYNKISTLEGIGEAHESHLDKFYILPNEGLRDKEIMHFEREAGIRCRKG